VAVLLTVSEIFSRIDVENRHFCSLYSDCMPVAIGGTPSNINVYNVYVVENGKW